MFNDDFSFIIVKLSFPSRGTREDFLYDGTFYEAVGFLVAVGQIFGVMPVSGIRSKSPKKLKFKKFSLRFILSIIFLVGLSWLLAIEIIWLHRSKVEFGKVINVVFDLSNLVLMYCFLELAKTWPELMLKWNEVEKFLPQLKYQFDKQVSEFMRFFNCANINVAICRKWLMK